MKNGQRSAATRMWNAGHSIEQISNKIGVPFAAVEFYLERRMGFPGKIIANLGYLSTKPAWQNGTSRPAPSLPHLKFLENGSDE